MPRQTPLLNPDMLKEHLLKSFFHGLDEDHRLVGLELELIPFRRTPHRLDEIVPLADPDQGLIACLRSRFQGNNLLVYAPNEQGTPRFDVRGGGVLTFEPGGQLEYSSPPFSTLENAIRNMAHVLEIIERHLEADDIWFFFGGLNPWYRVEEIGLQLTKERYVQMNDFFCARGPFGQKMMRLSTSLQVNLDVGDRDTVERRWLAANLMAPIICAAFANSPFCDRQPQPVKSYRSLIWQNLDPSRTGFQKGLELPDYEPCPVCQYLDFALDGICMRLPDAHGRMVFDRHFRTFRHWMEYGFHGLYPDLHDWEYHLSTLFPVVRPRGFFEMRYIDAQPRAFWMVPGVILTEVLYDEGLREEVIAWLSPYRTTLTGMLREAAVHGMAEEEISGLAGKIIRRALEVGQSHRDAALLSACEQYLETYTLQRRCPADDLLELNHGEVFTPAQYHDYERRLLEQFGAIPLLHGF